MLSHESKHLHLATLKLVAQQSLLSRTSFSRKGSVFGFMAYQEENISVVGSKQYDMEMQTSITSLEMESRSYHLACDILSLEWFWFVLHVLS